ncbi:MAG: hypothetical protein Terrestrivirus3_114 [Terrestrivirus sp.]|uniref:Uncharacterized protein n=1 Tax=Terrestrivirus sp. TaxID=2487775 RepID=A0A3G4ZLX3_9VIRU|nr:MAG: hypothetical protein Terrestrivirus3_114 [Terrestrivirus sp.]
MADVYHDDDNDCLQNIECWCNYKFVFPFETTNNFKIKSIWIFIIICIILNFVNICVLISLLILRLNNEDYSYDVIYFNYNILIEIYISISFVTTLTIIKFVVTLRKRITYDYSTTIRLRYPLDLYEMDKKTVDILSFVLSLGLNIHLVYLFCGGIYLYNYWNYNDINIRLIFATILVDFVSFVAHIITSLIWLPVGKINFVKINTPQLILYIQIIYHIFTFDTENTNVILWLIPFMTFISINITVTYLNSNDKMKRITFYVSVLGILVSGVTIGIFYIVQYLFDMQSFNYIYFITLIHGLLIIINLIKMIFLGCYVKILFI